MSLWHIAWSYLWNRKLTTCLTIASVALGVGLIYSVLTLREETRKRFEEEGQIFDVVVGAKGSPLQLVLSALYFMDEPTGNIALSDYEAIKQHEDVAAAFPVGMGDSYHGYRIVGTSRDFFDYTWTNASSGVVKKPFNLAEGRFFDDHMQAVIGSTVAETEGLKVGDTFVGAHGFTELPDEMGHSHDSHPYEVVGVLAPSGGSMDRVVFCSLDSVWDVHHHDETGDKADLSGAQVTAVLVSLHSPGSRFEFVDFVNGSLNAMATIPVRQIQSLYDNVLGVAKSILLTVGYLVVVISAISILIGLYLSILQRKRDLAIMRALGASASEIVGSVLIEALLVTVLGIVAGWLVGNLVCAVLSMLITQHYGISIQAFGALTPDEVTAFSVVALVGLVAGIAPAWQAYRTDVARDLAEL